MWNEIKDTSDIEKIMNLYGYFHDCCLRDIYISTRDFIDDKLSMFADGQLFASLLFQRQFRPNTVLELQFKEVVQFNFKSFEKNDMGALNDATLKFDNGLFYWAESSDWQFGDNDAIWISGKKLFWQFRPELIGNIKRLNDY